MFPNRDAVRVHIDTSHVYVLFVSHNLDSFFAVCPDSWTPTLLSTPFSLIKCWGGPEPGAGQHSFPSSPPGPSPWSDLVCECGGQHGHELALRYEAPRLHPVHAAQAAQVEQDDACVEAAALQPNHETVWASSICTPEPNRKAVGAFGLRARTKPRGCGRVPSACGAPTPCAMHQSSWRQCTYTRANDHRPRDTFNA